MAKYALINQDDKVSYLFIADTLEAAEQVASLMYGTKSVVEVASQDNADRVALGCVWDGTNFEPLPGTELDDENPTTLSDLQEPVSE